MKTVIFKLLFISISASIFSQSDFKAGYIITHADDTLYGLIDNRIEKFNSENCVFKKESTGESKTYTPREIKAYRITDGKYYVARQVTIGDKERWAFLEFLVDGRANLYYLPNEVYFIETEERGIQLLENTEKIVSLTDDKSSIPNAGRLNSSQYYVNGNEYIAYLKIYFQDSPEVMRTINNTEFNQKGLINITTQYHEQVCPDESCVVYAKKAPRLKNYLTINAGTTLNFVDLDRQNAYAEDDQLYSGMSAGILLGFTFDSYSIGKSERFSSSFTINYTSAEHKTTDNFDGYLKLQGIHVGFLASYIYPRYKIKPFAGLGLNMVYTFENEESFVGYTPIELKGSSIGPSAGIGATAELNQLISVKFMVDYSYSLFSSMKKPAYWLYSDDLKILLGCQFRLGK